MTIKARVLGIDVGTSGVRVAALDAAGQPLGLWRAALPAPLGEGACVSQSPRVWVEVLEGLLRELAGRLDGATLAALAIDGTSGTLLGVAPGRGASTAEAIGEALMYNDRRATAEAARIAQVAPSESGAHGASSSLAKWLWLHARGALPSSAVPAHQADWLLTRWRVPDGRIHSDENNALKLGYDPVQRDWPAWLDAFLPVEKRPVVHRPGSVIGRMAPAVARRLGLPAGLRLVAGTTDSIAAVYATAAREPGEAVSSLGSTLAVKLISDMPVFDPGRGVYSHRFGERFLVGGASNTGGAVLASLFGQDELEALSARIDPRRRSCLDYWPLTTPGERFPINDPALPPRLTPRPADPARYLHGLLESMARIEKRGYRSLGELGAPSARRIFTTGGGAANPAWTAIRERVLGCPVLARPDGEAAVGSARLALHALRRGDVSGAS